VTMWQDLAFLAIRGVAVLLKPYAHCIDGQADLARQVRKKLARSLALSVLMGRGCAG
jgi:hypothetical protein